MTKRPRAVPLAVGVSAAVLLGSAVLLRRASPERPPPLASAVAPDQGGADPASGSRPRVPSGAAGRGGERLQDGARPDSENRALDPEVERIYRRYRVALSTQDRAVEDALYPVLLARREAALGAARRDAVEASSPEEREWAERAARFLSDPPVPPRYRHPRRDP